MAIGFDIPSAGFGQLIADAPARYYRLAASFSYDAVDRFTPPPMPLSVGSAVPGGQDGSVVPGAQDENEAAEASDSALKQSIDQNDSIAYGVNQPLDQNNSIASDTNQPLAPVELFAAVRPILVSREGERPDEDTLPARASKKEDQNLGNSSGVLHKIERGDTLIGLASKYGVSTEAIIEANALEAPYILRLDQSIVMPDGHGVPPPAPIPPLRAVEHRVVVGDTLSSIALMYGVEPTAIARANNLSNLDAIVVGQILTVPGGDPAEAKAAPSRTPSAEKSGPTPSAKEAGPAMPTPTPTPTMATVKSGQPTPAASPTAVISSTSTPVTAPSAVQSTPTASPTSVVRPDPTPTQTPKPVGKGEAVASFASSFAGNKYLWGGHSPATGFDCTGFTWYVYRQVGINIPQHDLWGQLRAGRAVKRSELLPGDLVFFQNTYQVGLSHSGIYVGNGRFISAASEGYGVRFDRLDDPYWGPRYFGASRAW